MASARLEHERRSQVDKEQNKNHPPQGFETPTSHSAALPSMQSHHIMLRNNAINLQNREIVRIFLCYRFIAYLYIKKVIEEKGWLKMFV